MNENSFIKLFMHLCLVQIQILCGGEKRMSNFVFGFFFKKMRGEAEQLISERRGKAEPVK